MAKVLKREVDFTATGASFTVPSDCIAVTVAVAGTSITSLTASVGGIATDTGTITSKVVRLSTRAFGRDMVLVGVGLTDVQVLLEVR